MLEQHTLQTQPKFKEMKNIIHQDEKWFNRTRKDVTYYMTQDERTHIGLCGTRITLKR